MSGYLLSALLSSIGAEVALRVGILDGFITGPILAFVEGGLGGMVGNAIGMALLGRGQGWKVVLKDWSSIISSMLIPGAAAVLSQMYPNFLPVPRYMLILLFQMIVSMVLTFV